MGEKEESRTRRKSTRSPGIMPPEIRRPGSCGTANAGPRAIDLRLADEAKTLHHGQRRRIELQREGHDLGQRGHILRER